MIWVNPATTAGPDLNPTIATKPSYQIRKIIAHLKIRLCGFLNGTSPAILVILPLISVNSIAVFSIQDKV
jgi:hypothetical protein